MRTRDLQFQSDTFSAARVIAEPVPAATGRRLCSLVAAAFPSCGAVRERVLACGGFNLNSHNFVLETGHGAVVLKRKPAVHVKSTLEAQARVAQQMFEAGLPVPELFLDRSDAFVHEAAGSLWSLQRFVDAECYTGESGELDSVGELCATMAGNLRGLYRDEAGDRLLLPEWPAPDDLIDEVLAHDEWRGVARGLGVTSEDYEDLAIAAERFRAFRSNARCQTGVFHVDLHPHNLLMREGRVAALLDWDAFQVCDLTVVSGFGFLKLARQSIAAGCSPENALSSSAGFTAGLEQQPSREQLLMAGTGEVLKRFCHILRLNRLAQDRSWNHVLPIQVRLAREGLFLIGLLEG